MLTSLIVFRSLGTRLNMPTSDHPETDGQTERANRVLEEILRGYVHSFTSWSEFLSMVEFAINNSVHASTTHTPFYVNDLRHPRVPTLVEGDSNLRGGGTRSSKNRSGSCSSRSNDDVATCDADVDNIDIDEEKNLRETAITQSPIQIQTLMTMLVYSASPTTIPARKMTSSLKKRTNS